MQMRYNVNNKVKGARAMTDFYLDSNGKGRIHCRLWQPEGQPRAIVQIVHGIAEHIGRYDEFARFLTEHGFLVAAEDHMGHGGSVSDDTVQGYFHGGWDAAVADVYALTKRVRAEYPDVPYFILGHSMGSFLTRTYLFRYPDAGLRGALISGTGWQNPLMLSVGLAICRREAKKLGEENSSPLIQKLIFGTYNKQFPDARTENDWICSVPEVVDAYEADPMCGFKPSIGLAREMLLGIRMIQQKENLAKMPKELPVLFFAGAHDPVGASGKGVLRSEAEFKKAGMRDVSCRIYPDGRHEMLNESNKLEVFDDVLRWMESKL